jgi:hypothetical protein
MTRAWHGLPAIVLAFLGAGAGAPVWAQANTPGASSTPPVLAKGGLPRESCLQALGPNARLVEVPALVLAWLPDPPRIPLDRHFQLDIAVCGIAVTELRVDAGMPAHRHGMNYQPSVQRLGEGRYRVSGLLFHMPGLWQLTFDISSGGRSHRFQQDIEIP